MVIKPDKKESFKFLTTLLVFDVSRTSFESVVLPFDFGLDCTCGTIAAILGTGSPEVSAPRVCCCRIKTVVYAKCGDMTVPQNRLMVGCRGCSLPECLLLSRSGIIHACLNFVNVRYHCVLQERVICRTALLCGTKCVLLLYNAMRRCAHSLRHRLLL